MLSLNLFSEIDMEEITNMKQSLVWMDPCFSIWTLFGIMSRLVHLIKNAKTQKNAPARGSYEQLWLLNAQQRNSNQLNHVNQRSQASKLGAMLLHDRAVLHISGNCLIYAVSVVKTSPTFLCGNQIQKWKKSKRMDPDSTCSQFSLSGG